MELLSPGDGVDAKEAGWLAAQVRKLPPAQLSLLSSHLCGEPISDWYPTNNAVLLIDSDMSADLGTCRVLFGGSRASWDIAISISSSAIGIRCASSVN
jgi:hypothetical protein